MLSIFLPPPLRRFLARRQLRRLFPLALLQRHTYLAAQSGAGKSELLKALLIALQVQRNPRTVTVLIDPHGDLATECARLRYFRNAARQPLIAIMPNPADQAAPTLNPFDLCGQTLTNAMRERRAQQLATTFTTMLSKGDVRLTLPMKTVLMPLLSTLLRLSATSSVPPTFFELERFLDDRRNGDLIAFAEQHGNTGQQQFFRETFRSPELRATKFSLRLKLASLLQHQTFLDLLARPRTTWDLPQLLRAGNTIVVNTSRVLLGAEVSEIFGRTVVALLQTSCMERPVGKRVPVFLLLDEAASFVAENLKTGLAESRKFGLHYVLVHQVVKQGGHSVEFRNTLLGNTALKILGNVGAATRRAFAQEMDCASEALTNLPVGTFVLKRGIEPIRMFQLPKFWLGNRFAMKPAEWRTQKQFQRKHYAATLEDSDAVLIRADRQQGIPAASKPAAPRFGRVRSSFPPRR